MKIFLIASKVIHLYSIYLNEDPNKIHKWNLIVVALQV